MSISVNRALSDLKLVTKKIEQKQGDNFIIAGVFKMDATEAEVKEFTDMATSKIDQVKGLIDRRNKLKQAIVVSNANTNVTVADKVMTVAEAIERKASIEIERSFSKRIREQYYFQKQGAENVNDKAAQSADKYAVQVLSVDTEGDKGEEYKTVVAAYIKKNGGKLAAPKDIEKYIEDLQDSIDQFESDIDFILSESNIKTMIDV